MNEPLTLAMKPPCERDCPRRTVGCHAKCELYLEYEEAKQAEYRAREVERSPRKPHL